MANPYYTNTTTLVPLAKARAGDLETKFGLVEDGFDAVETAVNLKAPLASPTFTGTPAGPTAAPGTNTTQLATTAHVFAERSAAVTLTNKTLTAPVVNSPTGIVKADVGLGNVDNTSDASKPISTLAQAALDLKAPIASPTFTGVPAAPTAAPGTNTTQLATTEFVIQQAFAATLPDQTGNNGKFLKTDGSTASWDTTGAGTGSVTSVAMSVPAFLSVAGSPVTAAGTLAVDFSGTALPAANGGTGNISYTIGDILYASGAAALAKLAAVATGNVLISGGVGVTPAWGKVSLSGTQHVSGTLPVGNGGTGAITLTGVLKGNGTSAFTAASAGTDYVAPGGALGTPSSGTLTNCTGLPVAGGGTGRATGTTAYALVATGTTATGAQQSLAAGATTEVLVGGGASALPVWTTATGSGAPVRATSPVLTTPNIGTPSAGTLTNCTGLPPAGVVGTAAVLGANTFTGDQALGNNDITGVKTIGFTAEYDNGNSGASDTITLANGQKQKSTLTNNTTLTISTTGATVGSYQLRLIQDGSGGRTVTWSGLTSTRWIGSTSAPAINAAIAGETIITMFFDGTNITQSLGKVGAV